MNFLDALASLGSMLETQWCGWCFRYFVKSWAYQGYVSSPSASSVSIFGFFCFKHGLPRFSWLLAEEQQNGDHFLLFSNILFIAVDLYWLLHRSPFPYIFSILRCWGKSKVWFASKNLTPCRMHWNAFLIAQIIAKCHSFPNMYGML